MSGCGVACRLGTATVVGVVAVLAGCGDAGRTACVGSGASGGQPSGCAADARAQHGLVTGRSDGLAVTLAIAPTPASAGSPVVVRLTATDPHARGALGYVVRFGDGTTAESSPVPQFCLAGTGRPAHQTWRLPHRYERRGRYSMSATVYINCTHDLATVRTEVVMR